jgi:hypothetical protein
MGSFLGHIVPGTFFLLFSIWWTFSIFRRYFEVHFQNKFQSGEKQRKGGRSKLAEYRNVSSFLWRRKVGDDEFEWPLESWLKLVAVSVGMIGEFVTGFDPNGKFVMHNGQVRISKSFSYSLFFGLLIRKFFMYNSHQTNVV